MAQRACKLIAARCVQVRRTLGNNVDYLGVVEPLPGLLLDAPGFSEPAPLAPVPALPEFPLLPGADWPEPEAELDVSDPETLLPAAPLPDLLPLPLPGRMAEGMLLPLWRIQARMIWISSGVNEVRLWAELDWLEPGPPNADSLWDEPLGVLVEMELLLAPNAPLDD